MNEFRITVSTTREFLEETRKKTRVIQMVPKWKKKKETRISLIKRVLRILKRCD